jgi:trigger factor
VDAVIDRGARSYTKSARLPGFRPGKVPQTIVKQRFREEILHDVMDDIIPRAVDEALQERGIELSTRRTSRTSNSPRASR